MRTVARVAKSGGYCCPRRVYGRPARDNPGSVYIRMSGVSTGQTSEGRLVGPVSLVDITALGALARSIARFDKNYRHSGQHRFVGNKHAKLVESPTVENHTLFTPNR